MDCGICHEKIVPDKDSVIQVRQGHITGGEYQDFIPRTDIEYYHSGCYDGVEYPPRKEVDLGKEN